MPAAATSAARLEQAARGGWWLRGWASARVVAGVTDRRIEADALLQRVGRCAAAVRAEQVHGASVAAVGSFEEFAEPIRGCDALLTDQPDVALLIRTADCLPIFFADPVRGVVGLAHAGWRGVAAKLPLRMVAAFRHRYQSQADELQVAIGPAIRECCYEVGPEFHTGFGDAVCVRDGRRTCDLIRAAIVQLQRAGVRAGRITDTGRCTACEPQTWFSLRREGQQAGRMTSLIMVRS